MEPFESAVQVVAEDDSCPSTGPSDCITQDDSIEFTIVYNKLNTPVCRPADSTVGALKADIEERLKIPTANQKLLSGGKAFKDDSATLKSLGLKKGVKVMLLGSSPAALQSTVSTSSAPAEEAKWDAEAANERLVKQKQHAKILDKGRPDDALPSVKGKQVPLPADVNVIPGILNSQGIKVRLTFKEELQQLWIASATTTQKVPYSTITKIETFPIDGQEEYSIVALNLGSASSKCWLYFVPSQHTASLKIRILGLESLL